VRRARAGCRCGGNVCYRPIAAYRPTDWQQPKLAERRPSPLRDGHSRVDVYIWAARNRKPMVLNTVGRMLETTVESQLSKPVEEGDL